MELELTKFIQEAQNWKFQIKGVSSHSQFGKSFYREWVLMDTELINAFSSASERIIRLTLQFC